MRQSLLAVSYSPGLSLTLTADLANIARTIAEANPLLKHRLGDRMSVRRWWMDVDYPYKPPPTYERSG